MSGTQDIETKAVAALYENVTEVPSDRAPSEDDVQLNKLATLKQNPRVIAWCVFAVWVIVLTSFESLASSIVLGIPQFRKDFGYPFEGNYVLDTIWPSAISGGPVAT